jgi:hypothetical protein
MAILRTPYAHLLPEDAEVWSRWLAKWGQFYLGFEYDIRVGTGRDPGKVFPENIRQMAIGLSQRRIDAVGYQRGCRTIFEITRVADQRCIGQLISYPKLYVETHHPKCTIKTAVVCEQLGTDMASAFRALDIISYILGTG